MILIKKFLFELTFVIAILILLTRLTVVTNKSPVSQKRQPLEAAELETKKARERFACKMGKVAIKVWLPSRNLPGATEDDIRKMINRAVGQLCRVYQCDTNKSLQITINIRHWEEKDPKQSVAITYHMRDGSKIIEIFALDASMLEGNIYHELAHALREPNQPPKYIVPGGGEILPTLAEERSLLDYQELYLKLMGKQQYFNSQEIFTEPTYPQNLTLNHAFYVRSQSIGIYLLLNQGGLDKLLRFLKSGPQIGYEPALQNIYGLTFAKLDKLWEKWAETAPPAKIEQKVADVLRWPFPPPLIFFQSQPLSPEEKRIERYKIIQQISQAEAVVEVYNKLYNELLNKKGGRGDDELKSVGLTIKKYIDLQTDLQKQLIENYNTSRQ